MKIILFFIISILCFTITTYSQSTTLVISQVYGAGGNAGATYNADFVELHNKSLVSQSLNGLSIQYGSAASAGFTSTFNLPNVNIPAGSYYLIRMSAIGGVGSNLPTPDAIASPAIAMGGTAGKVALVNGAALITCPIPANCIDLVGYNSTSCYEGSAPTAALTATTAALRLDNGCQDNDQNSSDFLVAAVAPRNSSTAIYLCAGSCSAPTQNASNIRYGGSPSSTSMTVFYTRGNGNGAIVLCKQASPVNTTPVTNTTYTASSIFGSGSQIGTGNFVVHQTVFPSVNSFTLSNLTNGVKYYFSVFEYNDPGKCYTSTGLVDSFIVGGNVLSTGDIVFVGWDNNANAGDDKLYLMNMVDINKGTKFSITNSRFEAGASANQRTNKWYGGGSDPFQDPDKHDFEYVNNTAIAKGSIISMESNGTGGFINFTINGTSVPATDFSAKTGTSNFLSTTGSDADQLYITQGTFTPFGTAGVNRYNTFNGIVLHGFTSRTPWIPLTSAVSNATTGGTTRQSRIPPDIKCIALEWGSGSINYAAYLHSALLNGSKGQLLSSIKNLANWGSASGTTGNDVIIAEPNVNIPFTVNTTIPDGMWLGGSNDWFDCANWEGLHVPDTTTNVFLYGVPDRPNNTHINVATSPYASEYENVAKSGFITIVNNGELLLTGAGNDKLKNENGITIDAGGKLQFESNANATNDSLFLHNTITDNEPGIVKGFLAGLGTTLLDESRSSNKYDLAKITGSTLNFYNLAVQNTRSSNVLNNIRVTKNLNLQNGYLNIANPNGSITLSSTANITSPVNVYAQINKGYFNSFINGKMFYDADALSTNITFPIGKVSATDTLYAPVELQKVTSTATTYDAEYFKNAYSDLTVDIGQLLKVSSIEHWLINSSVTNADAKVTLSWRPTSLVGDGNPAHDVEALDSLCLAHYFNDGSSTKWRIDGYVNPTTPGFAKTGNVNYGTITTNIATPGFSPFTLGGKSPYNILPLKFIDFTATDLQNKIQLKWVVAQEQFISKYIIEKSIDGVRYNSLSTTLSLKTAVTKSYVLDDNNSAYGWNYYRIKIIDDNGNTSYSKIIKIWKGKTLEVKIYPTVTTDEIKINLPSSSSIFNLQLVNSAGQVVQQLSTNKQALSLSLKSLSKGVYFIKIIDSRQAIVQRFIKL